MKTVPWVAATAASFLVWSLPGTAQGLPKRRAGLWEITQTAPGVPTPPLKAHVCMSAEQASGELRDFRLTPSTGTACERRLLLSVPDEQRWRAVCTSGDGTLMMSGRAYDVSAEGFRIDTVMSRGSSDASRVKLAARWVAANCGAATEEVRP